MEDTRLWKAWVLPNVGEVKCFVERFVVLGRGSLSRLGLPEVGKAEVSIKHDSKCAMHLYSPICKYRIELES